MLVCLTQEAYNKFMEIIRPGGLLLTDPRYVTPQLTVDAVQRQVPMYETVMQKIGKPIVFNICMLGTIVGLTGLVQPESIMQTLETRIPAGFLEMNRQALELGLELGKNA